MMMESPKLVETDKGLHGRIRELTQTAERSIFLEAMSFESHGAMRPIVEDLADASFRGVDVYLVYDGNYSYFDALAKRGAPGVLELKRALGGLSMEAVALTSVGKDSLNPFAGRHHAKTYIFDDVVLTAGGANLTDDTFRHRDFMFEFRDRGLADMLRNTLPKEAVERSVDKEILLDGQNTLLIDAGNPGDSIIMERTVEMLDGASRAWYVSKMLPNRELYEALVKCPDLACYYNVPNPKRYSAIAYNADIKKFPLPNLYSSEATLHAKFCVAEYPDGSKRAITGSHNFNWRGVEWGTQELALDTSDPATCGQLIEFANSLAWQQVHQGKY